MVQYLEKVKTLTSNFKEISIKQVPWSENKKADALSKIASTSFAHLSKQVLVEELNEKSINEKEVLAIMEEECTHMDTPNIETTHGNPSGRQKESKGGTSQGIQVCRDQWNSIQEIFLGTMAPNLTPITSPLPFYKWGIDIAGPFPEGPSKVKFLIVAIDYFTKWIEAKPVGTITGNQVKKFVWDNIVCRFGLKGEIVSDNGK
ncbi:reverse transcriptase domain-containing protein [Tanacetum coccineum]